MKNTTFTTRFILLALLLCAGSSIWAQLTTSNLREIAPLGTQPVLSPQGDYVVVRDAGLTRINLADGASEVITHNADITGDIAISDGGSVVAFQTAEYKDHLRYLSINAANIHSGAIVQIDAPQRERYAFRFVGGKIKVAKRKTILSQRLLTDIRTIEHEYILAVEDDDLVLYDGTKRRILNPNGENIYLWQRLSPDEKHIVYVALNDACHTFVCDIDGKNIVDLGHYIGAPVWLSNDWIIGQQDQDDGHQMTASRLVAIRPNGTQFQVLDTPNLLLPINPTASQDGKVAFENEGKIYVMEVR